MYTIIIVLIIILILIIIIILIVIIMRNTKFINLKSREFRETSQRIVFLMPKQLF